ncbi:glycosyltransferase [uncultured Amphritea sp.]|uniref:glycosyltransferase n=1 Tax=uncultured Amphritea sp. TaxID=981605 RepID=UPI002624A3FF|nr:glycosyltransferase [uncultured Amphritea sp.]
MHTPAPRTIDTVLSSRFYQLRSPLSNEALNASIIIGICVRNQGKHLVSALSSAMEQTAIQQGDAAIVILDDDSSDDWISDIEDWLNDPRVIIIHALCGTAARARNALLDWVDSELPAASWIARLDADDKFAAQNSVSTMVQAGVGDDALYVLGSNHLEKGGQLLAWSNIADPDVLQDKNRLLNFIDAFCLKGAEQELPSCNLVLHTNSGIRYPDVKSAEDHWLVAELLMLQPERGTVQPYPIYSIYSLDGEVSEQNRRSAQWSQQRKKLATATKHWHEALHQEGTLLGVGQEGVVWRDEHSVYKSFYPHAMNDTDVKRLQAITSQALGPIPDADWKEKENGTWSCQYPWFESEPIPTFLSAEIARQFLKCLHSSGYVTSNIKRANLRLVDGELIYIDIGKDIAPLSPSRFLDASARLYSITVLGQSDYELARRKTTMRLHESLEKLEGFSTFYRELIEEIFPHCLKVDGTPIQAPRTESDVTLLIKSCPQDSDLLYDQVQHIVSHLSYPASFNQTVILIDTYNGPFLRQYAKGDLDKVRSLAQLLLSEGVLDEVWEAPTAENEIRNTYLKWFGNSDICSSHTSICAPLFPQLWAFDQIKTSHVLQCDSDVLIGRHDFQHNYLKEMREALMRKGVVSVGFNIPQLQTNFKPYQGEAGQFPPEIRCGLLHLPRLRSLCPLPNTIDKDKYKLMWHRSVQSTNSENGLSVRGGDHRTFYLHPMNTDKDNPDFPIWRDLISQGREPLAQKGKWDLLAETDWGYPTRNEVLIFLLKGRDTSIGKLRRCFHSLSMQNNQQFGLIVIDDGSPLSNNWHLPLLLGTLKERTTLIRRTKRHGHIQNFHTAVRDICTNPETMIVTLDLDDALMSQEIASKLHESINSGADLINGGMFRPDKPLHLYTPNFQNPREVGGGNVWAHLRGFRKKLFDQLPSQYLKYNENWVESATDYALMLPLAEMAECPTFIDEVFCYYHQRSPYSSEYKANQRDILNSLFSLPKADYSDIAEPALDVAEDH